MIYWWSTDSPVKFHHVALSTPGSRVKMADKNTISSLFQTKKNEQLLPISLNNWMFRVSLDPRRRRPNISHQNRIIIGSDVSQEKDIDMNGLYYNKDLNVSISLIYLLILL